MTSLFILMKYFQRLNPKKSKEFWRAMKYLKKQQSTIPTLVDENNAEATSNQEKADMLNSFFTKCFNPSGSLEVNDGSCTESSDESIEDLFCEVEQVEELLLKLDTSKSSGPDGISGKMLKCTAACIAPSVTRLFNLSIRLGKLPDAWKASFVVPIPKSSKNHLPSNYRPISLLCTLSKVLEKLIFSLIVDHLEDNYPLSDCQWGFRPGRSTVSALLSTTHEWLQQLESGHDVCAIFLDYKKAFDSVPHAPLINKLRRIGLHVGLLEWLTDYLTLRKQQVVVNGAKSCLASVTSGVPQGSVLGPLLFSIYINDITEVSLSPTSSLVMYADDILYHRLIRDTREFEEVQSDVTKLEEWSDNHLLQLNPQKCKSMILSKKRCPTTRSVSLYLCGSELEEVEIFKYLGVLFSRNLSWSDHISELCTKARRILGLLYRQFYENVDPATLKQLYISLVRPHLEYASQVWDPYLQGDTDRLEAVQKFALKLISRQWNLGYEQLVSITDVPKLSERRLHLKLAQVFKIVHSLCYFPEDIYIT